jgi:hypothetical protein
VGSIRPYLILFLKFLLRYLEGPTTPSPFEGRVRELVQWANTLERSRNRGPLAGDDKRSQVLSKLRDEFPQTLTKDLAFAVERVLQEMK